MLKGMPAKTIAGHPSPAGTELGLESLPGRSATRSLDCIWSVAAVPRRFVSASTIAV
jgi:hypothetical protein